MSSLFDQICAPENLRRAWSAVARKKSAPGVDGQSVEHFARHLDGNLHTLRRSMRRGSYYPQPLRGLHLPKRRGGWRQAGVPCVRDRVGQRAWLNVVSPILDARFTESSHAYRPARSIHTAIYQLERRRDAGCRYVFESDVANCFPSIDREWMLETLQSHIADKGTLGLAWRWMEAGVVWGKQGERQLPASGIAQGDLISPLLCNVFLDRFDDALLDSGLVPVRYADDFVIPVKNELAARKAHQVASAALAALGLELHRGKTRISHFGNGFEFVGALFVENMVLPIRRQEHETNTVKASVSFSYGYESPPPILPGDSLPPPPCPKGVDAISSALRAASARRAMQPFSQALQHALRQRRNQQHKQLQHQSMRAEKSFVV